MIEREPSVSRARAATYAGCHEARAPLVQRLADETKAVPVVVRAAQAKTHGRLARRGLPSVAYFDGAERRAVRIGADRNWARTRARSRSARIRATEGPQLARRFLNGTASWRAASNQFNLWVPLILNERGCLMCFGRRRRYVRCADRRDCAGRGSPPPSNCPRPRVASSGEGRRSAGEHVFSARTPFHRARSARLGRRQIRGTLARRRDAC